jgi:hypothetical protein
MVRVLVDRIENLWFKFKNFLIEISFRGVVRINELNNESFSFNRSRIMNTNKGNVFER